jgi:type I restriction enzyme S subunit
VTTFAELAARGSLLINDGYRTKVTELGRPGYPVLRVAEIAEGSVTPSYGDFVRLEYRDKIGYKLSQSGDVLLTTKGTVGRRAIMPSLPAEFAYSPQLCFFRALDDSIDNRWLYYWLGGSEFWQQAAGVAQQTDMAPYISLRDLRAIEIEPPPIEEQRGIAATLGALDDKIESNHRLSDLVLDLAEALPASVRWRSARNRAEGCGPVAVRWNADDLERVVLGGRLALDLSSEPEELLR